MTPSLARALLVVALCAAAFVAACGVEGWV